jgi:hypothetical protein
MWYGGYNGYLRLYQYELIWWQLVDVWIIWIDMAMDYNWFCAHILSIMMDVHTNISRRLQYRKLE